MGVQGQEEYINHCWDWGEYLIVVRHGPERRALAVIAESVFSRFSSSLELASWTWWIVVALIEVCL